MDKHEKELQLELAKTERWNVLVPRIFGTLNTLIRWGSGVFIVHLVFKGLHPFIGQAIGLDITIMRFIVNLGIGVKVSVAMNCTLIPLSWLAWYRERRGKQRAITKKSEYQKLTEANDEHRSSSKLTPKGLTPKGGDSS